MEEHKGIKQIMNYFTTVVPGIAAYLLFFSPSSSALSIQLLAKSLNYDITKTCLRLSFICRATQTKRTLNERGDTSILKPKDKNSLDFLNTLSSPQKFKQLARTYYRGKFYKLPHLMFVIDKHKNNKIYYINSKKFVFHRNFVNRQYKSSLRGSVFYTQNYGPSRRFYLGSIAYHHTKNIYAYEFFGGDKMTTNALSEVYKTLSSTFFSKLYFKPNSLQHENTVKAMPFNKIIPMITPNQLAKSKAYHPYVLGKSYGVLRIISKHAPNTIINHNEIVIYKSTPPFVTPLSGIIISEPGTPLAHIHLLAKSWGIPSVSIRNAENKYKQYKGKYVSLFAWENKYKLKLITQAEYNKHRKKKMLSKRHLIPKPDLTYRKLTPLSAQRKFDRVRFGAKASNLGELINIKSKIYRVPPGFSIPFSRYKNFIVQNKLHAIIFKIINNEKFIRDSHFRRKKLKEIRHLIVNSPLSKNLRQSVMKLVTQLQLTKKGVFVRSSSNAEDLQGFSGAGLYTSVPNVRNSQKLMRAIKTVFSSIWNFKAYEAREFAGIDHLQVYPSVLIQQGVNADSAGVLITKNPFNTNDKGLIYINAKRGLGLKVVEGKRIPEQILYNPNSYITKILTRSDEMNMLTFKNTGGIQKQTINKNHEVLSAQNIQTLARAALEIKRRFSNRHQDIEWLFKNGVLFIVQTRPYANQ